MLLFCAGKIAGMMLTLIYVLQLLAFISVWSIVYPPLCLLVLGQMRRIALGEVFDNINFGFADQLREVFGISRNKEESLDTDKAGKDRLGSTNLIENFGVSQIAMVLGLLLLFCLTIPIFCLSRKLKCCIKVKQKI